jgi:hypothetical protein
MKNIKLGILAVLFAVGSLVQAATYTPSFNVDYQKYSNSVVTAD